MCNSTHSLNCAANLRYFGAKQFFVANLRTCGCKILKLKKLSVKNMTNMRYDVKRFLIGNDAKISKFQKADAIVAGAMGPNNRYFHAPNVQMLGRVGTLRTCPIPPSVYLLPPWEFNPPSNIVEVCCVCFLYFVFSQTKIC